MQDPQHDPETEQPEEPQVMVMPPGRAEEGDGGGEGEAIQHPAKVMRIGSMVKQLLEEVRSAPLDEASRTRVREVFETSVKELGEVLSPELRGELERITPPFDEGVPTDSELRVVHAQLVGWLEGLFHGIQAMLFAQQMQSRAQLDELRRRGLPHPGVGGQGQPSDGTGTGTYL